jgi:hypothetical protein
MDNRHHKRLTLQNVPKTEAAGGHEGLIGIMGQDKIIPEKQNPGGIGQM